MYMLINKVNSQYMIIVMIIFLLFITGSAIGIVSRGNRTGTVPFTNLIAEILNSFPGMSITMNAWLFMQLPVSCFNNAFS